MIKIIKIRIIYYNTIQDKRINEYNLKKVKWFNEDYDLVCDEYLNLKIKF